MKRINRQAVVEALNLLARILIGLGIVYAIFFRCQVAHAYNYDYSSVEAYINDHKKQRSLLMARATLEYGNQLLHENSASMAKDYKELNFDLDKYTRAFDVIDVVYQSVRAAVNVYNTHDCVTDRLSDYGDLLSDFNDKIIKKGKLSIADKQLLDINYKAIQNIRDEGQYLYRSVYDLIMYCSGGAACSTADLVIILENINDSLDRLKALVNGAYIATWRYVQLRLGYWKEKIYVAKPRHVLLDDAYGRWRDASYQRLRNQ